MSNISTAYDEISGVLASTLPTHYKLINPYLLELNDEVTFDKAWGLSFSEGANLDLNISCRMSIQRNMKITLTRKIFAGSYQRNSGAISERVNAEKGLFEDQYLVWKAIEESPTITNSGVITSFVYQNDGGLEFIQTEKTNIIMLTSTFRLVYFEQLN